MNRVENIVGILQPIRRRLFKTLEAVLFTLVLSLLLLTVLQVFTRYVLHNSLPWTEEVARIALVWTVMVGAAIAADRREHYAITFISDHFRKGFKFAVVVFVNIMGLLFLLVLMKYGIDYVLRNMNTVYIATQVTKGFVLIALPTGAAIMAFSLIMHTLEAISFHAAGREVLDSGTSTLEV